MSNIIYGQFFLGNTDYYVFNNSQDTLYLTKIDVLNSETSPTKRSEIFDSIQIDGVGSKEVIFFRSYSGNYESIMQTHQEEEFLQIDKYEIWNIDTKTLLFEAVSYYEYRTEYWSVTMSYSAGG